MGVSKNCIALVSAFGASEAQEDEAQGSKDGTDSYFCKLLMKRILFGNAEKSKWENRFKKN